MTFTILGAGISGLTAAVLLAEQGYSVRLIEQSEFVGGLAATKKIFGIPVDIGSHRIHPNYQIGALNLVRDLISEDLLKQKRNGRILILDQYIDYPPSILSLLSSFGFLQCIKWGIDLIKAKFFYQGIGSKLNFADYTKSKVGDSLYHDFYEPYARKLWNLDPVNISNDPAQQRVRRMGIFATIKKFILNKFNSNAGYYFYPKHGIGQIAEKLKDRFIAAGGELFLNYSVVKLDYSEDKINSITVMNVDNQRFVFSDEYFISTLPIRIISKFIKAKEQNFTLTYRGLRVIYLKVNEVSSQIYETYYIPSPKYKIGRVSESAKYSNLVTSQRVLTIEIPCTLGDPISNANDSDLLTICQDELVRLKIISNPDLIVDLESFVVPDVYPVYKVDWYDTFKQQIDQINKYNNFYHFGRTALFLHCNIDHCIYMAQSFVELFNLKKSRETWVKLQKSYFNFYIRE